MDIDKIGLWTLRVTLVGGTVTLALFDKYDGALMCSVGLVCSFFMLPSD